MPQQTQTNCSCPRIEVLDQIIEVTMSESEPIVEVLIQGERGAKGDKGDSFNDTPFDFDPVEIYLNAKLGED